MPLSGSLSKRHWAVIPASCAGESRVEAGVVAANAAGKLLESSRETDRSVADNGRWSPKAPNRAPPCLETPFKLARVLSLETAESPSVTQVPLPRFPARGASAWEPIAMPAHDGRDALERHLVIKLS